MSEKEIAEILFSKDTKEIYEKFKVLELICDGSDELYSYFDIYLEAIHSKNACVRGRGFKLISRNAKWDGENKINHNLAEILAVLDDEKSTVVRQCLSVVNHIGKYKKELIPAIKEKLIQINYLQYKESMQGLIIKDIQRVLHSLEEYET